MNHARVDELVRLLQADPSETALWTQLQPWVNPTTCSPDLAAKLRALFAWLLECFPASPRHWLMYIEFEAAVKNFRRLAELFSSFFRRFQSFDLNRAYLNYIRATYPNFEDPQAREIIGQAYKFVLAQIEHDVAAGSVFSDYLIFLKSGQVHSPFEEQKKIEDIRGVYQRAVILPVNNVKQLWREWDTFENGIDKNKAKLLLSERSSLYLAAVNALRCLKSLLDPLDRSLRIQYPPNFTTSECSVFDGWRALIQWERTNPLKLRDQSALYSRVQYTYWMALHSFPRYPELWYEFSQFAIVSHNKPAEGIKILKNGITMCPGSFILFFALADFYELEAKLDNCNETYEALIAYWEKQYKKANDTLSNNSPSIKNLESSTDLTKNETISTVSPSNNPQVASTIAVVSSESTQESKSVDSEIKIERCSIQYDTLESPKRIKECLAICWVTFMNFTARAFGIKEQRAIFKRARDKPYCTWHPAVASAFLEFYRAKNQDVSMNLFIYAVKTYSAEVEPLLIFADWLLGINDDTNFISRLAPKIQSSEIPISGIQAICDKLGWFHSLAGSHAAIVEHEKKVSTMFPEINPVEFARKKYCFMNLDLVSSLDLGRESCIGSSISSCTLKTQPNLQFPSNNEGGSAGITTTCVAAGSAISALQETITTPGTKRRILDEWVAPDNFVTPEVTSGHGWCHFRLPKITEDDEKIFLDRSRILFEPVIRKVQVPLPPPPTGSPKNQITSIVEPVLHPNYSNELPNNNNMSSFQQVSSNSLLSNQQIRVPQLLIPPQQQLQLLPSIKQSTQLISPGSGRISCQLASTISGLTNLIDQLPTAESFNGPFFDVDGVIRMIQMLPKPSGINEVKEPRRRKRHGTESHGRSAKRYRG